MKDKKKKILISILVIFIMIFFLSGRCYAVEAGDIVDGVVGMLLLPAKWILIILGEIIGFILKFFAGGNGATLELEEILFNKDKIPLLDINFFDFNTTNEVARTIRQNVAIWYTSIRNVAAIALAIIAVYVGIRMAISTIAEDKAKYKTMLYDWLTSLALLFILHYIMIFTININNAFIDVLSTGLSDSATGSITKVFRDEAAGNRFIYNWNGMCNSIYIIASYYICIFTCIHKTYDYFGIFNSNITTCNYYIFY